MNSNQRSQGNNQSSNGGNEKQVSASRGGTVEKDIMHPERRPNQQPGTLGGSTQGGMDLGGLNQSGSQQHASSHGGTPRQGGSQQGSTIAQDSTDRTGSQTGGGSEQHGQAAQRQSNDVPGGMPTSPGTHHLSADRDMDDDTGLSNRANNVEIDEGSKQSEQSNVGRRSDMTPD